MTHEFDDAALELAAEEIVPHLAGRWTLGAVMELAGRVIAIYRESAPPARADELLQQIATCRDPQGADPVDVDDCVETLSKIIRGAKSIVGDLEEVD
jgi:hypothetical protein